MNGDDDPLEIPLVLYMVNKHNQSVGTPKSPDLLVSIWEHSLYFYNVDEEFTLTLSDGNGVPVYTIPISSTTSQIDLPESLIGDYELRLDTDDFYYVGYIELCTVP